MVTAFESGVSAHLWASLTAYRFLPFVSAEFNLWHARICMRWQTQYIVTMKLLVVQSFPNLGRQWPWTFQNRSMNGGRYTFELQSTRVAWIGKQTAKCIKLTLELQYNDQNYRAGFSKGRKGHINFITINFLPPHPKCPILGPQQKVYVPRFLGKNAKRGPT